MKKRIFNNQLGAFVLLVIALTFPACGGDDKSSMSEETMAGEMMAGAMMAGEVAEVTCEMQCADFATCAVDNCAGYTEESRMALYDGCMAVCGPSPMIASVYANFTTCEEKLVFAGNAKPGFNQTCAGGAESFCYRYEATCGDWSGDVSCSDWYNNAATGMAGDMSGASQACYEYHLGVAMSFDPDTEDRATHCPHAAGAAPCADATPASERAVAFCMNYASTCGDWPSDTPCEEWFDAAAEGNEGDGAGATKACYEYHLGVAMSMEPETHCPHAAGGAPCVDETPVSDRAVAFCMNYASTCGDWPSDTPCEEWFDAAAPGTDGDDSGASQACYEYHLGVAMTMDSEVHCPHAAGDAPCQ